MHETKFSSNRADIQALTLLLISAFESEKKELSKKKKKDKKLNTRLPLKCIVLGWIDAMTLLE